MKKMLLNYLIVTIIILVTFFSIDINVFSANFKYSDFNWEELLDNNKEYWVSGCDKGDEKCHDKILKTQKGFYERLYKILAHYQDREHITIDDNIIIETVFFELGPDDFRDPIEGEDNPYNIDEENATSYIGSNAGADGAVKYFENEEDSLKTLINNMVSYNEPCYGVSSETPTTVNGKTTCSGGFVPDGDRCEVLIEKLRTTFFGSLFSSKNNDKCKELASGYYDYDLGKISQKKEVDEEGYWDFLINSNYFDKKKHLQGYFTSILKKTNKTMLSDLDSTEYELYEEDIIKARTRIVDGIKTVLKDYKPYQSNVSMISGSSSIYWWPIGSDETTEENGRIMAAQDPSSVNITSNFGLRIDNSEITSTNHHGIDIGGVENVTNIIAVKDGTVVSIIDENGGQCVNGNHDCGGGYGNFIIIQHSDGNHTMYAHLATGSLTVKTGDVVMQGQVIGKLGHTGKSTGPHLHFEVRVGGNDPSSVQDPLVFVSPDNPRGGVGDIVIPLEFGNAGFFTYTKINDFNWKYNQKKVYDIWKSSGANSNNHIAVIDGRYLIACTTTFGNIGDYIDFYLEDGTVIETIMFDAKSQESVAWDRNPANEWGHNGGQQIIEFEITHNPNNSGDVGTWTGWTGKRVASATNLGKNIIQ